MYCPVGSSGGRGGQVPLANAERWQMMGCREEAEQAAYAEVAAHLHGAAHGAFITCKMWWGNLWLLSWAAKLAVTWEKALRPIHPSSTILSCQRSSADHPDPGIIRSLMILTKAYSPKPCHGAQGESW